MNSVECCTQSKIQTSFLVFKIYFNLFVCCLLGSWFLAEKPVSFFYYPPSSGISLCVRTIDTVMCLHTWPSPVIAMT